MTVPFFIALALNLGLTASGHTVDNNRIVVKIENLKSDKGVLIIALFNSEESYLKKDYKRLIVDAKNIKESVVFENVPQGIYSASIIHDENENGELDKNWIGIPKESFGFTKKSLGVMGPPSFKETCFEVKDKETSVLIKMKTL